MATEAEANHLGKHVVLRRLTDTLLIQIIQRRMETPGGRAAQLAWRTVRSDHWQGVGNDPHPTAALLDDRTIDALPHRASPKKCAVVKLLIQQSLCISGEPASDRSDDNDIALYPPLEIFQVERDDSVFPV